MNDFSAYNYCVSFLDVLGQKERYRHQGFVPKAMEDSAAFQQVVLDTVGVVDSLQGRAAELLQRATPETPPIQTMTFGDSIVQYVCLHDAPHILAIYQLIAQSGLLCFLGLSEGIPLRGAIDIAWAVELKPGNLYGAAPVKAYEYESEVAGYPRIVVSPRTIQYLQTHIQHQQPDQMSLLEADGARKCLALLGSDWDGYAFVDYLNKEFRGTILPEGVDNLYRSATEYVRFQLAKHQAEDNKILAARYWQLAQYFERNKGAWTCNPTASTS
ncbi:MAG: hypothetical protein HY343_07570 [Lentisphaerae bacterium]|nr:hypothetical protein [Lentisphaerota bacterium]